MRRRSPESPVEDEEPVPPLAKRGRGQPPKARPPGFPTGHAPPVAELLAALLHAGIDAPNHAVGVGPGMSFANALLRVGVHSSCSPPGGYSARVKV
jgi:hypothetical protein